MAALFAKILSNYIYKSALRFWYFIVEAVNKSATILQKKTHVKFTGSLLREELVKRELNKSGGFECFKCDEIFFIRGTKQVVHKETGLI